MRRALFPALVLALVSACGVPSSFDGVSGGTKGDDSGGVTQKQVDPAPATLTQDEKVTAPRPMSPISVSFVSTFRPRFKWALDETITGAVLELSQTNDFKSDVKRFTAAGHELVVTEDLAAGVWFWRLKGATSTSVGTIPSPIWELVVRGPAAHGTSDAPSRGMVDMNGDGEPDLIIATTDTDPEDATSSPFTVVMVFPGADGQITTKGSGGIGGTDLSYAGPISIGGGTDFDGDGITDIIEAGSFPYRTGTAVTIPATFVYGAPRGTEVLVDTNRGGELYTGAPATLLPIVSAAGDVDGDGYGDAVVGLDNLSFVALGATAATFAMPAMLPVGYPASSTSSGRSRIALGGFDANGDGLADAIFSYTEATAGGAFVAAGDRGARISDATTLDRVGSAPIAFTAGDFNGDGIDDVAFTITSGGINSVCVSYGDRSKVLVPGGCAGAATGETDYGVSLTAVDLEGDGVDEILATTKKTTGYGVRVIRATTAGTMTSDLMPVPSGVGVRLTTLWPGRPGMARWAAAAADGSHVEVYQGSDYVQSVTGDAYSSGFGRGLR